MKCIKITRIIVIFLFLRLYGDEHFHLLWETKVAHRNANKPLKKARVISIKAKGGRYRWLYRKQFPPEIRGYDIMYKRKNAKWAWLGQSFFFYFELRTQKAYWPMISAFLLNHQMSIFKLKRNL